MNYAGLLVSLVHDLRSDDVSFPNLQRGGLTAVLLGTWVGLVCSAIGLEDEGIFALIARTLDVCFE